ncbi:MAG: manganese efflux pump [Clostridia bacterium]|nr:manganese efflux pump [Clostridia bacterium]
MNFEFFLTAALLGCGLAMDAFSMSLANGLSEPCMKPHRMCGMAGIFAFFQCAMPLIGWVCVHTVAERFEKFERFIPWIAFALLGYIGGKMLVEGLRGCECEQGCCCRVGLGALLVQGVATSIDALSVGFTIADYDLIPALVCCLVIAALTFIICTVGILLGKRFGTKLAGKATVFGGVLLIGIGLKILISGLIA